jgi:vacuolar-type H+-ATPase subunit E/Vma4
MLSVNASMILQEILKREEERNELLKDSAYAQFALSDESIIEEAQKAYQDKMLEEIKNATKEVLKGG